MIYTDSGFKYSITAAKEDLAQAWHVQLMYEAIDAGLDEDDVEPPQVSWRMMGADEFQAQEAGPARVQFTLDILPSVLETHRAQRSAQQEASPAADDLAQQEACPAEDELQNRLVATDAAAINPEDLQLGIIWRARRLATILGDRDKSFYLERLEVVTSKREDGWHWVAVHAQAVRTLGSL